MFTNVESDASDLIGNCEANSGGHILTICTHLICALRKKRDQITNTNNKRVVTTVMIGVLMILQFDL